MSRLLLVSSVLTGFPIFLALCQTWYMTTTFSSHFFVFFTNHFHWTVLYSHFFFFLYRLWFPLVRCSCVSTTLLTRFVRDHVDSNEMLGEKLDRNYTRMLRAVLNKSCKQHPTKQLLYGYLPPISCTIQIRRARHVVEKKYELIREVLWSTSTQGHPSIGWPANTFISCVRTLDDILGVETNWNGWVEREREREGG